jgi:hypothetical protein
MIIGFIYAFGGLTYVSFLPVLLDRELHFGYLACSIYLNVLPDLMSAIGTGIIGRWTDRVNQWKAWAWIRLGWGMDPILLACAPFAASVFSPAAHILTSTARISRGIVSGSSWILWWQVGVAHFAPPGEDTTRYQGMLLFINGFARILAPATGAWLLHNGSMTGVLLLGGSLVLLSSLLSLFKYRSERNDERLSTIARFENGFH